MLCSSERPTIVASEDTASAVLRTTRQLEDSGEERSEHFSAFITDFWLRCSIKSRVTIEVARTRIQSIGAVPANQWQSASAERIAPRDAHVVFCISLSVSDFCLARFDRGKRMADLHFFHRSAPTASQFLPLLCCAGFGVDAAGVCGVRTPLTRTHCHTSLGRLVGRIFPDTSVDTCWHFYFESFRLSAEATLMQANRVGDSFRSPCACKPACGEHTVTHLTYELMRWDSSGPLFRARA